MSILVHAIEFGVLGDIGMEKYSRPIFLVARVLYWLAQRQLGLCL
jgi:hypothetical protein